MEQTRKQLKITSIVVLIFAGLTLLNLLSEIWFGELNRVEGASESILLIAKIFLLVVSLIMLLPQIYIGIKGLRMAKCPNSSKGHIIWAIILFVFSVLGLVEPVVSLFNHGGIYENISNLFGVLVEVILYFEYIKYARAVSTAN